jgi:uncharacterized protein YjeT (DUF2065 family)
MAEMEPLSMDRVAVPSNAANAARKLRVNGTIALVAGAVVAICTPMAMKEDHTGTPLYVWIIGVLFAFYMGWSIAWGMPAAWRRIWRGLRRNEHGIVEAVGTSFFSSVFSLLLVWPIGCCYSIFGGGPYQFFKTRRLARQ